MAAKKIKSTIMRNARRLLRFMQQEKENLTPMLIMTHDNPDPDAIASAFALQHIMNILSGHTARIAYGGIIGRVENRAMVDILKIPVRKLRPTDLKKYPNVALVDTQPAFENNSFPKNRRAAIVIDQHPSLSKPNARFVIVDTECGATSVLLAQCLLQLKVTIPVSLATALAYGILSDTLNLYRAKQEDIIRIYQSILSRSDLKALAKIQNPSHSGRFFTSLGKGIQNAMTKRGLIISHLGNVENPDVVSQITDFLLTYKSSHWAFCTGRYKGKMHVSLRCDKATGMAADVLRDIMSNRGDAGGHDAIAGGSFKVGESAAEEVWAEAEASLVGKLLKRLRIPAKSDFYYPFRRRVPNTKESAG